MKYRIFAIVFTLAAVLVLPLGYAAELADPIEQKTHDIMKVEEEQAEKSLENEEAADSNINLPLKPAEVQEAVNETEDVVASGQQPQAEQPQVEQSQTEQSATQSGQ